MPNSNKFRSLNPALTFSRFVRVRTNNPAPTSSGSDNDTCAATSALPGPNRNPRRPGAPTGSSPALSLSAGVRSTRVARSAGDRPNNTPVSMETAAVKPSTRGSGTTTKLMSQQPVGDVSAGDQQHQPHHRHQDEKRL